MSYTLDDIIGKCVEGKVARHVLESLEEEWILPEDIKKDLVRDLQREGIPIKFSEITVEGSSIRIAHSLNLSEESVGKLREVVEIYTKIYPENEVLYLNNK